MTILDDQQTSYGNPQFDGSFSLHRTPIIVEKQWRLRLGELGCFKRQSNRMI
jgi:hypothetical protein